MAPLFRKTAQTSAWVILYCVSVAAQAVPQHQAEHAASKSMDMAQVWRAALVRAPLAATAAFDKEGRLWLASVKGGHVWVSRSDDLGKTFGPQSMVNPEPEAVAADGENRPKIAVVNKTIYISYTQALDKPMTGHIRFSRSLDGGKTFSAPVTVNDNLETISHRFEAMAANERGEVFLAWLDKRDLSAAQKMGEKYRGAAIYYALSDNQGASFRPNIKLADHSCECCRVAMALDTDGIAVIMWRHVFTPNIRDHAIARLDGKSAAQRVSHDDWEVDACPHHGPSLSIGTDGTYHAVWFTNSKTRQGLFYARSTDKVGHFSTPLNFGNENAQAAHPYVLSVGKAVYLAWKEFDGKQTSIRLMRSADDGVTWSTPSTVAQSADASDHPLLIAHGWRTYLSWNTVREGYRLIDVTEEKH